MLSQNTYTPIGFYLSLKLYELTEYSEIVAEINKEKNTTIILTTHDTGDIEALTKRVILIGKGKLLLDGSLNSLTKKHTKKILNVKYKRRIIELIPGMKKKKKDKDQVKIEVDESKIKLADAIIYISNNIEVLDLEVKNTPIDDVVANLYKAYQI